MSSTTRSIEDTLVELDNLIARRRSPGGTLSPGTTVRGASDYHLSGGAHAMTPYGADSFAGSRYDAMYRPDMSFARQGGVSHNVLADKVAELRATIPPPAATSSGPVSLWNGGGAAQGLDFGYNGGSGYANVAGGGEVRLGQGRAHQIPLGSYVPNSAKIAGPAGALGAAAERRSIVLELADHTAQVFAGTVNFLQAANLALFFLNIFVVISCATQNWFGMNWFFSKQALSTLFTPADTAWCIWYLLFAFQILFTLDQLRNPVGQDWATTHAARIGWLWPLAQILQVCWTISFAQRSVWGNWVCLLLLYPVMLRVITRLDGGRLGCLAQKYVNPEERLLVTYSQWWIVYFGFQLQFAWITHQFLMAFNIVVMAYGTGEAAPRTHL